MGRAGSGSRSSSRSSSGRRSSGRSSSGHRSSSSRRAGSSSSSFSSSSSRTYSSSGYRSSYSGGHRSSYGGGYSNVNYGRSTGYNISRTIGNGFLAIFTILVLIGVAFYIYASYSPIKPTSTIARTKLENVPIYDFNVVTDEINYVEEEFTVGAGLKAFYEKTGIQPYVYFKAYDSSLTTDAQKDAYAEAYFDEKGFNENVFSFIYFEESNPDDVGYMSVVTGYDTVTVFDSEALNIFWNYWDNEWYGSGTTEDVVINAFTKTGDAIMKVSTNHETAKIQAIALIAIMVTVVVGSLLIVFVIRAKVKKAEREIRKTEANAKILSAPIEGMDKNNEMDEYK